MVYTMSTPWTPGGRNTAIQKAIAEVYERYFAGGPRWIAKHLPQRNQMRDYSSKLSEESKEILLGDYGVESFIEDYAQMAILASGDSKATRKTYTQWIFDETRHSQALWFCLVDSGLYTQGEMDEYRYRCGQDVWTFERQTGHEATPERGAAYAIAQERQTKKNYRDMQQRVWHEYGCPTDANRRAVYPAIAGVLATLATDEGYHEGVFRNITRIYLKFWPDKALQAMWDVYERYRMPMVKLPNAEAFVDAVLSTGIDSPRAVVKEILQPTYESLGLESRAAVKRAARGSWDLPDGAVIQVGDTLAPDISKDAIPYRMNPDGSFTPVTSEIN
jgi:hypothetical protein